MKHSHSKEEQKFLLALDQKLAQLPPQGHSSERAAIYLQKASLYLGTGEWEKAAAAFATVAQLAQGEGQGLPQAQARYAQGLILQTLGKTGKVSSDAPPTQDILQESAQLFESLGDNQRAAQIRQMLQDSTGNFRQQVKALSENPQGFLDNPETLDGFVAELQQAVSVAEESLTDLLNNPALGDMATETKIELHCFRAQWYRAKGEEDAAQREWEGAIALSQQLDRPDLLNRIQAQQQAPPEERTEFPSFDPLSLAEIALRQGMLPLQDVELSQALLALQQNEWEQVVTQATQARKNALRINTTDRYARYFAACLLMALGQEGLQDDAGALESLLMCKATLDQSSAQALGKQVNQFAEGLEVRWGKERFRAAKHQVQEKFAKQ